MDIRCKTCSKLFRIADEKIAGKGIRFKCSQCGEVITVLREDLERDRMARENGCRGCCDPSGAPAPIPTSTSTSTQASHSSDAACRSFSSAANCCSSCSDGGCRAAGNDGAQHPVSTGLDDFDFSAPHEAAVADAEQSAGPSHADPFANLKARRARGRAGRSAYPRTRKRQQRMLSRSRRTSSRSQNRRRLLRRRLQEWNWDAYCRPTSVLRSRRAAAG